MAEKLVAGLHGLLVSGPVSGPEETNCFRRGLGDWSDSGADPRAETPEQEPTWKNKKLHRRLVSRETSQRKNLQVSTA